MGFLEEEHAEATLPDAAADGEGELAVEEHSVEVERGTLRTATQLKLTAHSVGINAQSHRRELHRRAEHWIPNDKVAVKPDVALVVGCAPVVVVGGTPVVGSAVAKRGSDTDDKDCTIAASGLALSLRGSQFGIHIKKLLRV